MLINCALTPSPYSALHSGKVGMYVNSTTFTLNPAFLLLFSVIVVYLIDFHKSKYTIKLNVGWLFAFIILLSGIINSRLFESAKTYVYDLLVILFVCYLSIRDGDIQRNNTSQFDYDYKAMSYIMMALMMIGLILVYLASGKYGIIYFEFSRKSRGEVTIWSLFSVPVFLVIFSCINDLLKNKSKLLFIITIISVIITLSTATRTQALLFMICLFVTWLEQDFNVKKLFGFGAFLCIVIFGFDIISDFFLLNQSSINSNTVSVILNGRFGLWEYYWNLFVTHPIIGYGPVSISYEMGRLLGATSEIGILKNATTYGIFFVIVEIYVVLKALRNSMIIIKSKEQFKYYDQMIVFLFWCCFPLIIQQHARILNYSDFIFWYSSFYLCYRLPKQNIVNINNHLK